MASSNGMLPVRLITRLYFQQSGMRTGARSLASNCPAVTTRRFCVADAGGEQIAQFLPFTPLREQEATPVG